MKKLKVFISSVQSEFAQERQALWDYLNADALLGKFFEPFIFEQLPAVDKTVQQIYLDEVEKCDVYIGLLGLQYGYEDSEGISPTEREFDHAGKFHKTRFVFLTEDIENKRHSKEKVFISKVQNVLVRKHFSSIISLKTAVYNALIKYLEEKEIIRTLPFDASVHQQSEISDLDKDRIVEFVKLARSKRGFSLHENSDMEKILTHLNLLHNGKPVHAALLLFGKTPQQFFINSEIRCANFHGTIVEKPIPSYKVFKGDVFQLVNQAVDFVLSKLDYTIGTRAESVSIPGQYEIPKEIVTEAIVNAVAHRDYTSNASVQVMLFKDRLEIWNPGSLPYGWTTQKLKITHNSVPANPLLAEPMYLAGYIERLGTGTSDIIRIANEAGLPEPDFIQEEDFKTVIYRKSVNSKVAGEVSGEVSGEANGEVHVEVDIEIKKIVLVLDGAMKRSEIQTLLDLKHDDYFRVHYIQPALEQGLIQMRYPETPNHPKQRYLLTDKGKEFRQKLKDK